MSCLKIQASLASPKLKFTASLLCSRNDKAGSVIGTGRWRFQGIWEADDIFVFSPDDSNVKYT